MSIQLKLRQIVWACAASSAVFVSCFEQEGGLNENERTAGNGDNGVSVGFGEIAIDPTGHYLISAGKEQLVYGDLQDGSTRVLDGLSGSLRVAFDHTGRTIFATRTTARLQGNAEVDDNTVDGDLTGNWNLGQLVHYDTQTGQPLWERDVGLGYAFLEHETYPWLDVSDDDQRIVLTYEDHVEVVDATNGKLLHKTRAFASRIVDVDLTPDQKRVVITLDHAWEGDKPKTTLALLDLEAFTTIKLTVPNCADELVITPDGKYGLLAPTTCQPAPDVNKDPVSVIDLQTDEFVRNLPGFGPVALAPDGAHSRA